MAKPVKVAKTVEVTVSMPAEDVERLKAFDATGAIESVSAGVAAAATGRLSREEWLRRWRSRVGEPDTRAVA